VIIRKFWRVLTAATAVVALSCDTSKITAVQSNLSTPESAAFLFKDKAFFCPSGESATTTAEVGPLGGLVSVGGTSISIPVGALLETVTLTVTEPASRYMEVDISVAGAEHFIFQTPVVVTVSYARCNGMRWGAAPLAAWYFEGDPENLLELMPSVDNRLARTVTFVTGHLSGYILAN
jgi:hypothetical protein